MDQNINFRKRKLSQKVSVVDLAKTTVRGVSGAVWAIFSTALCGAV